LKQKGLSDDDASTGIRQTYGENVNHRLVRWGFACTKPKRISY